jgi:hypothetical protein
MQIFFRILFFAVLPFSFFVDPISALASSGRQRLDADTEYMVEDQQGRGFTLRVEVSKYQFVPDMRSIAENCRAAAALIAQQEASARKITGKLDIAARVETDRNALLGRSSCVVTAVFQTAPPNTFPKSPILDAAIKKVAACNVVAANLYSATNNENARTIAEAVCSRCSKDWDEARKIATQLAVKFHNPEDGPLLNREVCVSQNTNLVIELRARRALTPANPKTPSPVTRKDQAI